MQHNNIQTKKKKRKKNSCEFTVYLVHIHLDMHTSWSKSYSVTIKMIKYKDDNNRL